MICVESGHESGGVRAVMRALFGSGQWILGSGRENRGGPSVELWVVCVSYSAELRAGGSELGEKCRGGEK